MLQLQAIPAHGYTGFCFNNSILAKNSLTGIIDWIIFRTPFVLLILPNQDCISRNDAAMLRKFFRRLTGHSIEPTSCSLHFGARSLRRMRWQTAQLFRR
jgi:hypothetical protein